MNRPVMKYVVLGLIAVLIAAGAFGAFFDTMMTRDTPPSVSDENALNVPSGQPISFHDTIMNQPGYGLTARFRFIAPELDARLAELDHEELEADLSHLCNRYAVPRLKVSTRPSTIVISLSNAPLAFGDVRQDITQIFEAYSLTDQGCEWKAF